MRTKGIFVGLLVLGLVAALSFGVTAAELHAGAVYNPPPQGHFNTFATNTISLGIWWDVVEQPLGMYYWATDEWMKLLAVDWELLPETNPDTFRVHLRQGVKWHDGNDFTSKDVISTFYLGYLFNWAVWNYVDKVEAVDDYTVDFHMDRSSSVVPRYILREHIRAYSVYGEFYEELKTLLDAGKDRDSEEVKLLRVSVSQFRPRTLMGTGPYTLDPADLTEAAVTIKRFPGYWDAGKIKFDALKLYNGETPTISPLVMAKEVDYATHGFPPATEKQFKEIGIRIARPPIYSGPAVFFNHNIYPLNRKEVRQAIAYAINKDENANVSLADSARRQKYMTGLSDNILPLWLAEEDIANLEEYRYNTEKAAEILTSIGFKKGSDGVWVDDKGKRMEYDLLVPQEYSDWSAAALNAANQLTNFGIKTEVRGMTYSQVPHEVWNSRFEMAVQGWGAGNPHPHFSYYADLVTYNYPSGQGPGMNFPLVQQTDEFGEVDLEDVILATADGFDGEMQAASVTKLAKVFNDILPIVPLWERYGNNPVLDGVRATNWPDDDHMIWSNSPYGDNPAVMLLLDGVLEPVK
mgnify:CR=1 FL=1